MNHPGDISQWVQKAEEDYQTAVTMVRKTCETRGMKNLTRHVSRFTLPV